MTTWQSLFDHSFFFLADVLFLILGIWAARIVSGTKWNIHLNWIVPGIFESGLALLYRLIWNAHFFTGVHLPQALYSFTKDCLYTANAVGIYGAFILCRTLQHIIKAEGTESANSQSETGVWPPPPTSTF